MQIKTPSKLNFPAVLMNFPLSLDTKYKNNAWMDEIVDIQVNYNNAFNQFRELYKKISQEALIYILPSDLKYQDQVYVANLGCYLPHLEEETILLSNYKSPPRVGEDIVGRKFFESMGYNVYQPSTTWEGEADLKYLRNNIYIGGYGIRTDIKTHYWMMDNFEMEVVSIFMEDLKLYHFDCVLLPFTKEKCLVAIDCLKKEDLRKIEHVCEIIPVPKEFLYDGWTNSFVVNGKVFYPDLEDDSKKAFEEVIIKNKLQPIAVDLEEFEKSGALLSCMLLTLSYIGRDYRD